MQSDKKQPYRKDAIRFTLIFFTGKDEHKKKIDADAEKVKHGGKMKLYVEFRKKIEKRK